MEILSTDVLISVSLSRWLGYLHEICVCLIWPTHKLCELTKVSCRIGVVLCELHSSLPVRAVLVAVISSPEE